MPQNITDADTFDATVQVPADSDAAGLTYLLTAFQSLANRTKYLYNRFVTGPASSTDNAIVRFDGTGGKTAQNSGLELDDSAELNYTTPPSRTTRFSGAQFVGGTGVDPASAGIRTNLTSNSVSAMLPLAGRLPDGAVINTVRVLVDPGAARAAGNRMLARFVYNATKSLGGSPSAGTDVAGTAVYDDTTANIQVITLSSVAYTVDSAAKEAWILVVAGNDATTNPDYVYSVEIDWTDPGPRNY